MAALRCSIWTSNHDVRMDYGLSLVERDVPTHSDHFVLAVNGNLFVHFSLGIKPRQCCFIQRSNGGEMRTGNLILLCKFLQSGESLVSLVEDDRVFSRLFATVQQLNLHPRSFSLWAGFRRRDIVAC